MHSFLFWLIEMLFRLRTIRVSSSTIDVKETNIFSFDRNIVQMINLIPILNLRKPDYRLPWMLYFKDWRHYDPPDISSKLSGKLCVPHLTENRDERCLQSTGQANMAKLYKTYHIKSVNMLNFIITTEKQLEGNVRETCWLFTAIFILIHFFSIKDLVNRCPGQVRLHFSEKLQETVENTLMSSILAGVYAQCTNIESKSGSTMSQISWTWSPKCAQITTWNSCTNSVTPSTAFQNHCTLRNT